MKFRDIPYRPLELSLLQEQLHDADQRIRMLEGENAQLKTRVGELEQQINASAVPVTVPL